MVIGWKQSRRHKELQAQVEAELNLSRSLADMQRRWNRKKYSPPTLQRFVSIAFYSDLCKVTLQIVTALRK